jgi:uncharacterized protein YndB with AHSA1/START domain
MSADFHRSLQVDRIGEREIRTERTFDADRHRVWHALTEPDLVAQWWGRGNRLVIERMEVERGGHWRYVEHAGDGAHGFEGRYREIVPYERIVRTFEWDGMPGYVSIETIELEVVDDDHTNVVTTVLFHSVGECNNMIELGMTDGMEQSYKALDRIL